MINRTLVALSALIAFGTLAQAQVSEPLGFSVRAGLFFPSSDAAKREADQIFGVGLEFGVGEFDFLPLDGDYTVSVDWHGAGDFSSVPILFNFTHRNDDTYYSAGAGWGFVRVPQFLGGSIEESGFAYQVSVGKDFARGPNAFFVELKYFGSSESTATGIGLFGGLRL